MRIYQTLLAFQVNPIELVPDVSVWSLAVPALIGAVGITLIQKKVNRDNLGNALGKVLVGFGIGYFGAGYIALKTGFDKPASAFFGGLLSPAILVVANSKVSSLLTSKEDKDNEPS